MIFSEATVRSAMSTLKVLKEFFSIQIILHPNLWERCSQIQLPLIMISVFQFHLGKDGPLIPVNDKVNTLKYHPHTFSHE